MMMAWAPFAIMSLMLLLSGLVRQEEGESREEGPLPAWWPAARPSIFAVAGAATSSGAATLAVRPERGRAKPERAEFEFAG